MFGGRKLAYLVAAATSLFQPDYSILDKNHSANQAYAQEAIAKEAHAMIPKTEESIRMPASIAPTLQADAMDICSKVAKENRAEIKSADLESSLKSYAAGDPLIFSLFSIIKDAKSGSCYSLAGDSVRQVFTQMGAFGYAANYVGLNDFRSCCEDKCVTKTFAPIEELEKISARTIDGRIEVSISYNSRQTLRVFKKFYDLPKKMLIKASICGTDGDYIIDVDKIVGKDAWVAPSITEKTGIGFEKMVVHKNKDYPNIDFAADVLSLLNKDGKISINPKKSDCEKHGIENIVKKDN